MSEFQPTTERAAPSSADGADVVPLYAGEGEAPGDEPPSRARVKVKKLRLILVLSGVGLLAVVSTVFGMMMAVASDLPRLEALDQPTTNSTLVDRYGKEIGLLTGNTRRIFLNKHEPIAPVMRHAIVAIEDRRFFTNPGIDLRSIARALWEDVRAKKAVQGGSTITQQFVKNALEAQNERTLFQKLREAAMAFHMTKKWPKEKILRNYLNTIYFGNGAYGIESAARTYFGKIKGCTDDDDLPCAARLDPQEAALLAGVVANPAAYDPIAHPGAATARRNLVLQRMLEQGYLTRPQYQVALAESVPTIEDIEPPAENTDYPYFTSWVKQQIVDRLGGGQVGARRAFEGGLTIETTIDSRLQDAAQRAVDAWLPPGSGPEAALVAIENRTGEVVAMVGGPGGLTRDERIAAYGERPFNLATQGQRQPGSAFKPFVLAEALKQNISPTSVWTSRKKEFCVTRKGKRCVEAFEVNNYEDAYAGITTLARATTFSDNSVYAELGLKVGTKKVARLARRMGIRTPVSANPAMTLGGLKQGVTVLDMAHAYHTFANSGRLRYGRMGGPEWDGKPPPPGPIGVREIRARTDEGPRVAELPNGEKAVNEPEDVRVLPKGVADQVRNLLTGPVNVGTGTRARIGPDTFAAGKTGTTENYGDAWFVGWTERYTVAVWVGYPDKLVPMETEFRGEPVAGGTFPAAIWRQFMVAAIDIFNARHPKREEEAPAAVSTPAVPVGGAPTPAPTTSAPSGEGGGGGEAPSQQRQQQERERQLSLPEQDPPSEESGGAEAPPPE